MKGIVNQSCPAVSPESCTVRMWGCWSRRRLDLAMESLGAERLGQLGMEHLQRDWPLVPEVEREEHGGHAAPPELAFDAVPILQTALEPLAEVHHGGPTVLGGAIQYPPRTRVT